ncbi:hypothetical protein EYR41_004653 [Orbilia oligospora]|uniref:DUF7099 domain-containing protein n=1 Tax=Orbilia oligospora TaxID=2813651 RepID=A0A7C8KQY0_ORBOL|nr:hypothetical protein TWF751_006297 [Orbilia oligospora]TGJ72784.1 hypothetical protein EYR41_004653 [Orbilia oligospora]
MSIFTIAGLSSFYSRLDGRTDVDSLCEEAIGKYVLSRSNSDITGTTDRDGPASFKELAETIGSVFLFQLVHQFRQPIVTAIPESQDPSSVPPRLHSLSPDKVPSILRYLHQQYRSFYPAASGIRRIILEVLFIGSRLLHIKGVQARRRSQWFHYLAGAVNDPDIFPNDGSVDASISFGIKAFLPRQSEQGSTQQTSRDLRYFAGVPYGIISNPLNPLDFGRVRNNVIELQQQSGATNDQIDDIDYFWSMCDILYVLIAASAEPYRARNTDDYSRELSSLAEECRTYITHFACDKLGYVASLAEEVSRAETAQSALARRSSLSRTSEFLRRRELLTTINDRTMARVLDSIKTLRQGSYNITDKLYASNCPEGHVLNEIQKESFLVEYERRAGIRLRTNENSIRVAIRTPDAYPCPVCSEISRIDYSQDLGSLTSLTEITQFTALSRILQDAKGEVSSAVKDMSRHYHMADQRLEVNFSRNGSSNRVQPIEQGTNRQNGRLSVGETPRSNGQSSQSSSSSSRDSISRSSNTPLPSPNGSSSSTGGLRKFTSTFGLMKLGQTQKEPEINLTHFNADPISISIHTGSSRVFFYGKSSISIYSYASIIPEPRARIELVAAEDSILRSMPTSISISPSKDFLAVAVNLLRGNSQIQVWSLGGDGYSPKLAWYQILEGIASGLVVHPDENFLFVITNKRTLNAFDLNQGSRVFDFDIPAKFGFPNELSVVGRDILLFRCFPDVSIGQMKIFTLKFGISGCQMGWDDHIQWPKRERDDNGVSALSLCETKASGSTLCYSTWTMSGQPSIIRWGAPGIPTSNDKLHDVKLGTRIQDMAIVPNADFMALINGRGDIWQYAIRIGSRPKHLKTISFGSRRRSAHDFKDRVCLKIDEDHNKIIIAYTRDGRGYIEKHDMAFGQG